MRLDKLIEKNLHAPRKEIKRMLVTNQVKIDGISEKNGSRNVDSQLHRIEVAGQKLQTHHRYFLLNKPAGVVTAVKDEKHQTVIELITPADRSDNLQPSGRLDRDTSGLLLLTDNGQLIYELVMSHKKVAKTYEAWINEPVTANDVAAFAAGITFHGGITCKPARLEILQTEAGRSYVRLEIAEGKFHQVKKMFLACGKKVDKLKRVAVGPLKLPTDLAPGAYRQLTPTELESLKSYFI